MSILKIETRRLSTSPSLHARPIADLAILWNFYINLFGGQNVYGIFLPYFRQWNQVQLVEEIFLVKGLSFFLDVSYNAAW
ncbi:MAG: hypothetical protein ABI472_04795 [Ginsengibacter sp.]